LHRHQLRHPPAEPIPTCVGTRLPASTSVRRRRLRLSGMVFSTRSPLQNWWESSIFPLLFQRRHCSSFGCCCCCKRKGSCGCSTLHSQLLLCRPASLRMATFLFRTAACAAAIAAAVVADYAAGVVVAVASVRAIEKVVFRKWEHGRGGGLAPLPQENPRTLLRSTNFSEEAVGVRGL